MEGILTEALFFLIMFITIASKLIHERLKNKNLFLFRIANQLLYIYWVSRVSDGLGTRVTVIALILIITDIINYKSWRKNDIKLTG